MTVSGKDLRCVVDHWVNGFIWIPPVFVTGTLRPGRRGSQFMSPSEHAPGPRGSPQEPHPPEEAAGADEDDPLADTAKTESCGESLVVWHLGHAAFCLP